MPAPIYFSHKILKVLADQRKSGKLGDLHGHRGVFLAGMTISALFVVCSALAWSGPSLIAFRVLAATAGAATGPSSLAIINGRFEREDRSKALGF